MKTASTGVAVVALAACTVVALAHDHGAYPATASAPEAEARYLAENEAVMARMMTAMAIAPSGDVDRDFVAMMTPHHQGGIDMALAVLKHGKNEQLRRLAQEIIVEQQQEIAAMKLAIGDPLPPSAAAPTQVTAATDPDTAMPVMSPDIKM